MLVDWSVNRKQMPEAPPTTPGSNGVSRLETDRGRHLLNRCYHFKRSQTRPHKCVRVQFRRPDNAGSGGDVRTRHAA